jgi:ankyrin repeat protein
MCVLQNETEKVRVLLAGGANVREPSGFTYQGHAPRLSTPLKEAVKGDHSDMVQLLLEFGADITDRNSHGGSLLHTCSSLWMGDPSTSPRGQDVAARLIQHGVDLSFSDDRGWTALHTAA